MPTLEKIFADVAQRWRDQSLTFGPRSTPADVARFQTRFQVECPEDFAAFLMTLGGMPEGTWDEHLIRFLPLDEIGPATDDPGYFVFADYSISAHEYGIHLAIGTDSRRVALLRDGLALIVAPTFTNFLELYLENPTALFE
jgi:hypothetical protein